MPAKDDEQTRAMAIRLVREHRDECAYLYEQVVARPS
jgi:hypothetical protein